MKIQYKTLLASLFIMTGMIIAHAQESVLFSGSFEDCKKQALRQRKMILVDLYFEGCMPCKEMDDRVFPDPAVVQELEPNFLLYKADVFKEEDGKKLARKYGASGFPTYVILDAEGKAVLIESGFFGVDRFVPLLQRAKKMKEAKQFLAFDTDLDKEYPPFYNYRFFREGEKGEITDLSLFLEDKNLEMEVPFVISTLVNTPEINEWTYDHLPLLLEKYGYELLRSKVTRMTEQKAHTFGEKSELESLYTALEYVRPVYNDKLWSVFLPSFITAYYKGSLDAETYLFLIDKYKIYPDWAHRSNALGPVIIDQRSDKDILKKILKEFENQNKSVRPDFPDQYKLALLYTYLEDFIKAEKIIDELLKGDLDNPYYKVKKEDLEEMKLAVRHKDTDGFEPKDVKKIIGFKMD